MRRILLVLTVALVMAAMMVASTMPVFAQGQSETAPNCEQGNNTAFSGDNRNPQAFSSLDKNYLGPEAGKERGAYCLQ